jgi:hypothetical protein
VDEAVRIWRATSRTTPVEIFITAKGRECGRGIELAVELAKRGVPVNYGPVRARESGALGDLPRPVFGLPKRDSLHTRRALA